jgi:transposase
MTHPKMLHTYVGVDSHKETHTAVLLDCFFEKQGEITFGNRLEDFTAFLSKAQASKLDGTTLLFGLEDVSNYGRSFARFLMSQGQTVKHVNAFLVSRERKNLAAEKTDFTDAEAAARVLISQFGTLPNAEEDEQYHILRTLVVRRDGLTKSNVSLKHNLHDLLTQDFPNYQKFFCEIAGKTALAFFTKYPSPDLLHGTTAEDLGRFLREHSGGALKQERAEEILAAIAELPPVHAVRNRTVQSTIRQLQFNIQELECVDADLAKVYGEFDYTLTSMTGLDVLSAAQLLSCIGDVRKFSTPAKLARYAGIAPITHSSGKKDMQYANMRGDRELNSLFYRLAVRLIHTYEPGHKAVNPFFYEYYHKKMSEGKTKRQALKCVQRRLVNIIWTMLTNNEDYVNPPMIEVEKHTAEDEKPKGKRKSA